MNISPKTGNKEEVDNTSVTVSPDGEVRFVSGKSVCIEALIGGQWVGRYRSADGRIKKPYWQFAQPAFDLVIRNEPLDKGVSLSTGWQWVSAGEISGVKEGCRHFAVELSNAIVPINVKIHTLLDGTAVFTRWLEITNSSDAPVAMTGVVPWAGGLWDEVNEDVPIRLGCSTIRATQDGVGSFAWRPLVSGPTVIENTSEPCYDDPFFILQNRSRGEFVIGGLAWPSIYRMTFDRTEHQGLAFAIGPIIIRDWVLRVLSPGETVQTPAVHLGHLKGDFDAAVQEMHEHVRRSVISKRPSERSHRIQYIANNDTGINVYIGKNFNESNLRKCIDVAAAVGAGRSLEEAAPSGSIRQAGPFSEATAAGGVTGDPAFIGTVFVLPVGRTGGVLETQTGYAIARVDERTPMSEEEYGKQKDMLRARLLQQKQQQAFGVWFNEIHASAKIEDNRRRGAA